MERRQVLSLPFLPLEELVELGLPGLGCRALSSPQPQPTGLSRKQCSLSLWAQWGLFQSQGGLLVALPAGLSDLLFSPECPAERHVNSPACSPLEVQGCPVLCSPDLVRHCHKATTSGLGHRILGLTLSCPNEPDHKGDAASPGGGGNHIFPRVWVPVCHHVIPQL
ncbi:hypothetical protein mRhiFer1_008993 [Rhinolophus ferrumequinum]|uniref:Uncharacterized protein n=1 Tax=Rhinolophus ferrumequinum TaxID=59479 RepID=A0A7J7TE26_RHIFE|nr:hypothetical protein mRhiFer1_008993 [Rhinolophus ferrumequinum]